MTPIYLSLKNEREIAVGGMGREDSHKPRPRQALWRVKFKRRSVDKGPSSWCLRTGPCCSLRPPWGVFMVLCEEVYASLGALFRVTELILFSGCLLTTGQKEGNCLGVMKQRTFTSSGPESFLSISSKVMMPTASSV